MSIHFDPSRNLVSSPGFFKNKSLIATGAAIGLGIVTILAIKKIREHNIALKKQHKARKVREVIFDKFGQDVFDKIITNFNMNDFHAFQLLCRRTHVVCDQIFKRNTSEQIKHLELPIRIKKSPFTVQSEIFEISETIKEKEGLQLSYYGIKQKIIKNTKFSLAVEDDNQLIISRDGIAKQTITQEKLCGFYPCSETECITITDNGEVFRWDLSRKEPLLQKSQNLHQVKFLEGELILGVSSYQIQDYILLHLKCWQKKHFVVCFLLNKPENKEDFEVTLLLSKEPSYEVFNCYSDGIRFIERTSTSDFDGTIYYTITSHKLLIDQDKPLFDLKDTWQKKIDRSSSISYGNHDSIILSKECSYGKTRETHISVIDSNTGNTKFNLKHPEIISTCFIKNDLLIAQICGSRTYVFWDLQTLKKLPLLKY